MRKTPLLDNFGFTINLQSMDWQAYRAAVVQLRGRGFLGRLWCRYLRPALFPKRHALLAQQYEHETTKQLQKFVDLVLREAATGPEI